MSSLDLIDWRLVGFSSLWILGLGGALAALSFADAQARQAGQRLRAVLGRPPYRLAVNAALILFCLGLLGSARTGWEAVLWAVLAGAFGVEAWRARPIPARPARPWTRRRRLAGLAGGLLGVTLAGVAASWLLPDVLGLWAPRHYLILALNADELRPSGGFITGAGHITVAWGRPVAVTFGDANQVDDLSRPYPLAPAPLEQYMRSELWLFRDANWSPDFPTAAQQAAELYTRGTGRPVDTVLAFDQVALQYILAALGPVRVPGFPDPVTDGNVLDVIRGAWSVAPGEPGYEEWEAGRKDVFGPLTEAILERLRSVRDPRTFWRLALAGARALDERHALLYLPGPLIGGQLRQRGWDGAVAAGAQDYVRVVDANVGFNKANAVVAQRLAYQVDLRQPERPAAVLTVHYAHAGEPQPGCEQFAVANSSRLYRDYIHDCYWNYWRVLLPYGAEVAWAPRNAVRGSLLLSGQADFAPAAVGIGAGGTAEVSGLFVLPPGAAHDTVLAYHLPARVLAGDPGGRQSTYRLRVQKQPGTGELHLELSLTYPPEWAIAAADPAPAVSQPGLATFSLASRTDLEVEIVFRRP